MIVLTVEFTNNPLSTALSEEKAPFEAKAFCFTGNALAACTAIRRQ